MSRSISQIIADHKVTEDELNDIMRKFDTNEDGKLQGDEIKAFAAEVAPLVGSAIEDLIEILDFYQLDEDDALTPEEIQSFLEIHT